MRLGSILIVPVVLGLVAGCGKTEGAKAPAAPPVAEVKAITVTASDTAVTYDFVGQTQSSRQVEIVARVNGFLEKQFYTDGAMVKAGQVLFRQDPRPFQAQVDAALGALAQQEARLQVARDNLARVKPLTEKNALSQKDLTDAIGQEKQAAAAVDSARADVQQQQLNLNYTTIASPVTGLSSYARMNVGAYLQPPNNLLTTVEQIDPIYVNFSVSENDLLKVRGDAAKGLLRLPPADRYEVQIELADGSLYPDKGFITFADAGFNQQTGTYLLRATLPNKAAVLKPNQFVKVHLGGIVRPNAILVPQEAVQQGAQGNFTWVVNKEGKAEPRPVQVGPWHGKDWFITEGLAAGDVVAVSGLLRLAPGAPVRTVEAEAANAAGAGTAKAASVAAPEKK